jgi:hypothetical protein
MIPNIYTIKRSCFTLATRCGHKSASNRYTIVFCGLEFDENIDGIIEAGSCSWILSKDIETYGIVKFTVDQE